MSGGRGEKQEKLREGGGKGNKEIDELIFAHVSFLRMFALRWKTSPSFDPLIFN